MKNLPVDNHTEATIIVMAIRQYCMNKADEFDSFFRSAYNNGNAGLASVYMRKRDEFRQCQAKYCDFPYGRLQTLIKEFEDADHR